MTTPRVREISPQSRMWAVERDDFGGIGHVDVGHEAVGTVLDPSLVSEIQPGVSAAIVDRGHAIHEMQAQTPHHVGEFALQAA